MDRQLPISSKLGFGVGQVAEGVKTSVFNTFVLFYYNQIIGVSASLTALVLGLAVLADALTDPVAGYLSDRTKTRFGRRHPWMLTSALPFAASILMMFNPPADMSQAFYMIWLLVAAVSLRLFLTLYHIPHLALGAEMAHDYTDRTRVFAYSTLFGALGGYGFYFIALSFIFPSSPEFTHGLYNPGGYGLLSVVAASTVLVSILLCVAGTWKEIPYLQATRALAVAPTSGGVLTMLRELGSVFRNPSFRVLFVGSVLASLVLAVEGTFNTYMGVHFWELPTEKLRWVGIATIAGLPISFMLAPWFTRWFDKRNALVGAAVFGILNSNLLICLRLFTDVLPGNESPVIFYLVLSTYFLGGSILPIVAVTLNSMLADIADEQELATENRQEGVIYSARAFSLKATSALGAVLGGIGLDLISFPTQARVGEVAPEVIWQLGLIAGPVTSIFTLMGVLFFLNYRLDRDRVLEIKSALSGQRSRQVAGPPAEAQSFGDDTDVSPSPTLRL